MYNSQRMLRICNFDGISLTYTGLPSSLKVNEFQLAFCQGVAICRPQTEPGAKDSDPDWQPGRIDDEDVLQKTDARTNT